MLELSDYQKRLLIAVRRWQLNFTPGRCDEERLSHLDVVRLLGPWVPRAFIEWDCPRFVRTHEQDEEKRLECYELICRKYIPIWTTIRQIMPSPPFDFSLLDGRRVSVAIVKDDPDWDCPILKLISESDGRSIEGDYRLDSKQRHLLLTRNGLELADSLLELAMHHPVVRWSPPAGALGTKEIMSSPRFAKSGKNPPRTTIQDWQNKSPPLSIHRASDTGETYYPEEWVFARIAEWNPRPKRRRP